MITHTFAEYVNIDAFPFPASMTWDGLTSKITCNVDLVTLVAAVEHARTWKQPLDPAGVAATLNVVLGLWPLEDAANAVGLTPDDLIAEAQAWEAAETNA
jgi:hypothetical protein